MSEWRRGSLVLLVAFLVGAGSAAAQGMAESAAATAKIGGGVVAGSGAKKVFLPAPGEQQQSKFQHVAARTGEPAEVANRRALEEGAGADAGKLLLRSTPSKAQVWISGKLVGRTPLLLILAPGSYQVQMRGMRDEEGQGQVELKVKETREFVLALVPRYPARVRLP